MKTLNCPVSSCRNCQHYQPEGRRGGHCQQLGVPVQGSWKACSVASPAFTPSWENIRDIMLWQEKNTVTGVHEENRGSTPSRAMARAGTII